jgi:hypothetical protein
MVKVKKRSESPEVLWRQESLRVHDSHRPHIKKKRSQSPEVPWPQDLHNELATLRMLLEERTVEAERLAKENGTLKLEVQRLKRAVKDGVSFYVSNSDSNIECKV